MDGWEFLARIRQDKALASVPVVIASGLADRNLALAGGACAVVQKPVGRAQLKSSLASLGLEPASGRTHSVLVVDDDPRAVEMIAAFLPGPAYAVVRAYGGVEAVALAQRLKPDLILLDLMMPEMNGFDVVDALHRDSATASIPILVVAARQITTQDRAALERNAAKPVQIVENAALYNARFMSEVRRALSP
jgi:CheY-like chemotaxis protein